MDLIKLAISILTEPKHTRWIAPCLILAEAVLCGLIVWKVPYTEIDYTTYLHQVSLFLSGERKYTLITGPSGPLVYPAVHVYVYSALYYLTTIRDPTFGPHSLRCTEEAGCTVNVEVDIGTAQLIFAALYLITLAVVVSCYRRVGVPAWLLAPLVLSKRMHSIFLLRLFNDGWATLAFWLAVSAFQKKRWGVGAAIWCLGVGIKMTVLLAAPAVGAILVQGSGTADAFFLGVVCVLVQGMVAVPFLRADPWAYLTRAFELSRQFLFKWTVNWRFMGEETFLSKEFAVGLLVLHASILLLFLQWKWVRPSSNGILDFARKYVLGDLSVEQQKANTRNVTPTFVMDAMLGSLAIGLLCARSLHYQFYAYLGWATPYLLWRAGSNPAWVLANWAVQEYCWLVFPSTNWSSALVVLELVLQVVSGLLALPVAHDQPADGAAVRPRPEK